LHISFKDSASEPDSSGTN